MGAFAKFVCLVGAGGAAVGSVYLLATSGRKGTSFRFPLELSEVNSIAGEPKQAEPPAAVLGDDQVVIVHRSCLERLLKGDGR